MIWGATLLADCAARLGWNLASWFTFAADAIRRTGDPGPVHYS